MMVMAIEVILVAILVLSVVSQQPLSLGMFLLVFCFMISSYIFSFFSSWFALSLFLVYVGGMLVLFGYVLVLIPNFVFSLGGVMVLFFSFFLFYFFFPSGFEGSEMVFSFSFSFFSSANFFVYVSLGVVLFVGLVSVAKLCFFQVGALRPFFLSYV